MKICQYIPHGSIPDVRGFAPAIVAQHIYKNLFNHEHYFVSNKENYENSFEENKEFGAIYRIKESNLYRRLFRKITKIDPYPLYVRLAKIVNKNPVDILHVHQLEFPIDRFKKLIKNKKIKIIVHVHVNINKPIFRNIGLADKYIAVSSDVKNMLLTNGYPENLINIVSNGVDTSLFNSTDFIEKNKLKDKFNIPKDKIIFSFIGRKQEVKGFEIFLKISEYLLSHYNNIYIISIGSEPEKTDTEKSYATRQIIRNKLINNENYIDLKPLSHDNLHEIFKISDITCLLSKNEPQGMVMLESISSGCITLSTSVGGIIDTIKDNFNGFLVQNPYSYDEAIVKVKYILENINYMEEIKHNARKYAVENFDWKILSQKLEELYREVLKETNE